MDEADAFSMSLALDDRLLIVAIAAATAAIFGMATGTFHWRREKRFETFRALANEFISLVDTLQKNISEYWAQDYTTEAIGRLRVLEEDIKSRHFAALRLLVLLLEEKAVSKKSQVYNEQVILMTKLYEACTGGEFEVAGRKYSKGVIARSNKIIIELKHNIYNLGFKKEQLFRARYK